MVIAYWSAFIGNAILYYVQYRGKYLEVRENFIYRVQVFFKKKNCRGLGWTSSDHRCKVVIKYLTKSFTSLQPKVSRSPLDYKKIKPVNPEGNQPRIVTGGADDEAEAPILWPPDVKNWLIRKDPDSGKDWRQEKGWMASLTQCIWVWANSGRWWRTGKLGVLQSMGSQSVILDWLTEQQSLR